MFEDRFALTPKLMAAAATAGAGPAGPPTPSDGQQQSAQQQSQQQPRANGRPSQSQLPKQVGTGLRQLVTDP